MGWNRVAHPTEGSPRRGLHGVPAILCGLNAVKDARRLLYLSKLGAKVVWHSRNFSFTPPQGFW